MRFLKSEDGATSAEYALLLVILATVAMAVINFREALGVAVENAGAEVAVVADAGSSGAASGSGSSGAAGATGATASDASGTTTGDTSSSSGGQGGGKKK